MNEMKGFCQLINFTMKNSKNKRDYINNNDDSIMNYVTKAYMYILRSEDWGKDIPIVCDENSFYKSLYLKYNNLTDYVIDTLKNPTLGIIKEVVHRNPKSVRRTKKNAKRILKNGIKAIKMYRCNEDLIMAKKSMDLFYDAIRESFIIFRRTLSKDAYNLIPSDMKVTLNGADCLIRDLYKFDNSTGKYRIDASLNLSVSAMKDIQYQMARSIFACVHINYN